MFVEKEASEIRQCFQCNNSSNALTMKPGFYRQFLWPHVIYEDTSTFTHPLLHSAQPLVPPWRTMWTTCLTSHSHIIKIITTSIQQSNMATEVNMVTLFSNKQEWQQRFICARLQAQFQWMLSVNHKLSLKIVVWTPLGEKVLCMYFNATINTRHALFKA